MKYITIQGDMWDSISYKFFGDENHVNAIIAANPRYRYIYIFSAGIELDIPDLEENEVSSGLPPWKRAEG